MFGPGHPSLREGHLDTVGFIGQFRDKVGELEVEPHPAGQDVIVPHAGRAATAAPSTVLRLPGDLGGLGVEPAQV